MAAFDEVCKGVQQIEFIKQQDAGELRVGSAILVEAGLLPAIIEQFSREFPRVVFHLLQEDITTPQYDNLRKN